MARGQSRNTCRAARATTTEDRVILLSVHKTLMDAVERNCVAPDKLAEFRTLRMQDYRLLLISEAIIGRTDGMIDPVKIVAISQREVNAGRLPSDDELHTLAVGNGIHRKAKSSRTGQGDITAVRPPQHPFPERHIDRGCASPELRAWL